MGRFFYHLIFPEFASGTRLFLAFMRPYTEVVSAKNVLNSDLGPIGSLDSLVIKQIAQLSNSYSGVFSTSRPTVLCTVGQKIEKGPI